jgi:hypothetical protein
MLHNLLEQLFKELGLGSVPPLDEQKQFHLKTSRFDIALKEIEPNFYFSSDIGPLPLQKKEVFLMRVMKANFLGQGTGGATIGLKENESCLTLSLSLPYDMNYITFKESLEDFANYLDYWKQEIVRHESEANIS